MQTDSEWDMEMAIREERAKVNACFAADEWCMRILLGAATAVCNR